MLNLEVRVAGTHYPNFFVFPATHHPGTDHPIVIPAHAILGFHGFEPDALDHVSEEGKACQGGPELWYHNNATLLPEEWPECEKRVLRLPFGTTSPDFALAEHQKLILEPMILYGADGSQTNLEVARAPVLKGTGVSKGKGNVPHSLPLPVHPGRGGGGNAPFGPVAPGGPVASAPAEYRPRSLDYPKDQFGCYIIPQYFDIQGWSIADWQRYWRVPEPCIARAMAYEAEQLTAAQQPGARLMPRPQSRGAPPTWLCGFCNSSVPERNTYCGQCGSHRGAMVTRVWRKRPDPCGRCSSAADHSGHASRDTVPRAAAGHAGRAADGALHASDAADPELAGHTDGDYPARGNSPRAADWPRAGSR